MLNIDKTLARAAALMGLCAALLLLPIGVALGATVDRYLRVDAFTILAATFDNPDPIFMWGFADCGADATFTACGLPTVPGPDIAARLGDTLNIHVKNNLPAADATHYSEPLSVVIPGQTTTMTPVWIDAAGAVTGTGSRPVGDTTSRVRSFTSETAVGGTSVYTWPRLKAGTFLYESGTHPGVQVPMGLYGAVKVLAATGQAYGSSTAFASEVTLLFSEIDPVLHDSIAAGHYGSNPPASPPADWLTSPIGYHPKYFLVNGAPFTSARPNFAGGRVNQKLLVRFLNAGLDVKVPQVNGAYLTIVGDSGNLLPFFSQQYSLLLAPGATADAILTPAATGTVAIYDRRLNLTNAGSVPGGQQAYLTVLP